MAREFPDYYSDARERSHIGAIDFGDEPSLTKQEFKDECDINVLMAKYTKTGVFPEGLGVGNYADFSDVPDYQSAIEIVRQAEAQFNGLPSKVRERFKNDPAEFLAFVQDRSNLKEAAELGLLAEEAAKVVLSPPVVAAVPPVVAK